MVAMFFVQPVILRKTAFSKVPTSLQPDVKEVLSDSELGWLKKKKGRENVAGSLFSHSYC